RCLEIRHEGIGDPLQLRLIEPRGARDLVIAEALQQQVAIGHQATQAGRDHQQRQQHNERETDGAADPLPNLGSGTHLGGCGGHTFSGGYGLASASPPNATSKRGYRNQPLAAPNNTPVSTRSSQVLSRQPKSCVKPSSAMGKINSENTFTLIACMSR